MAVLVSSSFCVALPSSQVLQFSLPMQDIEILSPESVDSTAMEDIAVARGVVHPVVQ